MFLVMAFGLVKQKWCSIISIHIYKYVVCNITLCVFLLQHLRVEENPLLKISHLEAASILLVGPTLKKFNDRGTLL